MYADRGHLDTGAGDQDASDEIVDTMPLTHTMVTLLLSETQRMEIFGACAKTACSDSRVVSMKKQSLPCTRWSRV